MRSSALALLATLTLVGCAADSTDVATASQGAGKKTTAISTPVITVTGATTNSISLEVCAGATGLPAGFSVQWMEADGFTGWPADSDTAAGLCKASLGGNANLSRFALEPYACTTVEIGHLFDEEPGVSFTCNELTCGTDYVFRAFGHATSTLFRSAFTGDVYGSTLACEGDAGGCTLTQGYWKTHNESSDQCTGDPATDGPLCVTWPVSGLTLGTVSYTNAELVSILTTPAQGNGLISLAHQLIAAELNIASGADPTDAAASIASADALIAGRVVPPIGTGYLAPSSTSSLTTALTNYNEGVAGPGHCQ